MSERHGERPDTPETEPAPTITSKARTARWYDVRQNGARPRAETEPAPTMLGEGLSKGVPVWRYVNGNQDNAARRPATEPAPTVHFAGAINDVKWVEERPSPTVVTTRRSKDGLLIGRQLPDGEGENIGGHGWGEDRPSTSVMGDPRIFQPGGHHQPGEQSQNAVRVTIQEASILQSFPPDYPWQGSRSKQFQQVGNAIPPLMARAIIAALVKPEP